MSENTQYGGVDVNGPSGSSSLLVSGVSVAEKDCRRGATLKITGMETDSPLGAAILTVPL